LTQHNDLDIVLHVGDFGYDLPYFGDQFFNSIEPIASRIPYMGLPGNHEVFMNFTQYRNRFTMPNSPSEGIFYRQAFFNFADQFIFLALILALPTLSASRQKSIMISLTRRTS
jgi:hypothetical protein